MNDYHTRLIQLTLQELDELSAHGHNYAHSCAEICSSLGEAIACMIGAIDADDARMNYLARFVATLSKRVADHAACDHPADQGTPA